MEKNRDEAGAAAWIERLGLEEHPEGGYFRETYRSEVTGEIAGFQGERELATSIYFLITDEAPSNLHRLRGEEIWNWHAGSPLTLHLLDPEQGGYRRVQLGGDLDQQSVLQTVVPAGVWFGATVEEGFALVGCTVVPGFRFEDFAMGERQALLEAFPDHPEIVTKLTAG